MTPDKLREQINQLALPEKLLLVGEIWDSIAASNHDIPMADWHKAELDKRYQDYKEGKLGLLDWEGVHENLRDKYQMNRVR
jgi:putative addiction module component (TIGR02574 family)